MLVQWLTLHAFFAIALGLIPGWGTNACCVVQSEIKCNRLFPFRTTNSTSNQYSTATTLSRQTCALRAVGNVM